MEQKEMNSMEQAMHEEYKGSYTKQVHRIGRVTMVIALVLSFLPILFLNFVMGYRVPLSVYLNVTFALTALCIGMWLTEPLIWYPILGAAPTYMAYLSGNVKNIRVPVARSVMKKYGEHTDSPRGQILATFSVAVTVFANLAILDVIPSLIGALICFRIEESGWIKTLLWSVPAVVIYILVNVIKVEALADIGEALSIGITILIGYGIFRMQGDKEDRQEGAK